MIDFGKTDAELDDLLELAERAEESMKIYVQGLCEVVLESLRDRLERAPQLKNTVEIWMHNIARLWEQDKEMRLKRWHAIENKQATYKADLDAYISKLKSYIPRVGVGETYRLLAAIRKVQSVPRGGKASTVNGTPTPIKYGLSLVGPP